MKLTRFLYLYLGGILVLVSCETTSVITPAEPAGLATETSDLSTTGITRIQNKTPASTLTPTKKSTATLTPTNTRTPAPTLVPRGGGNGYLMMLINLSVVKVSAETPYDFEIFIDDISHELGIDQEKISTQRDNAISPDGNIIAFWNCSSIICDTEKGTLYLYNIDLGKKIDLEVPGDPSFGGWSEKNDRLLYYLGSTMADDYYMITTTDPGMGEVVHLGRVNAISWAPDHRSIYAQKGNVVTRMDLEGNELDKWTCNFNNACMLAPSPDGKRFAGIQKFIPTRLGNPVITITNKDFTEKETVFISEDKALILGLMWLPDNQHLVVYGQSARQRLRRYFRLDYLSVLDLETGNERLITLDVPEESENFHPCALSPDGKYLIYLGVEGRVKEKGRIFFNSRYARMFILSSSHPKLERVMDLDGVWESCPTWLTGPLKFIYPTY